MENSDLTAAQLQTQFAQLTNWQDRYRSIILLGKTLVDFPEQERKDEQAISGCENKVWLTYIKNPDQTLTFYGDSEGRIIKGLLAILLAVANGKTAKQLLTINFDEYLHQLKIFDELSHSRQLGLKNIIQKIQLIALTC